MTEQKLPVNGEPAQPARMKMDIYQLTELVHVEKVWFDLAMHMNLIKTGPMQQKVDQYNERKQQYYTQMVTEPKEKTGSEGNEVYPPLYWFELTYFKENDWGLGTLEPWPPPFEPHQFLLPQRLINQLASYPINAEKMVRVKADLDLPVKRTLVIQFVRYSDALIFGTVQEDCSDIADKIEKNTPFTREESVENQGIALRVLMHRMYRQPGSMKHFINAFARQFPELLEQVQVMQ